MVGTHTGSPVAQPDEAIEVARAKRDHQAFAPLYLRYFDRVYAYCYRRLGTADEAADATSIVFARALASLASCRDDAFRSWLFAIAHNALADQFRQKRTEYSLDEAYELTDSSPSPEEAAIAEEQQAIVTRMLAELPADQRHVLELRLAGLTSREIGEVLGKQANAIDQAQFRAMTRLRLLASTRESWIEAER